MICVSILSPIRKANIIHVRYPGKKGMKIIRGIVLHSYTMYKGRRSGILVSVGCRVWVKVRGQMDQKAKSTTPI